MYPKEHTGLFRQDAGSVARWSVSIGWGSGRKRGISLAGTGLITGLTLGHAGVEGGRGKRHRWTVRQALEQTVRCSGVPRSYLLAGQQLTNGMIKQYLFAAQQLHNGMINEERNWLRNIADVHGRMSLPERGTDFRDVGDGETPGISSREAKE